MSSGEVRVKFLDDFGFDKRNVLAGHFEIAIAFNAGAEPSVVVNRVREGKDDFGFNALHERYEPLVKAGVIDPTKVVRSALQNAASVAGLLLTTEAAIAEKPEKKAGAPAAPGGGDYDEDY